MKVSVIGLGYIGLPTAIVLAMNGHMVYGYDTDKAVIDKLNAGCIHIKEQGLQEVFASVQKAGRFKAAAQLEPSDVYIIAVPTPFKKDSDEKSADMSYVKSAAELVAQKLKEGDLVILESTVPPLSTREMTDILCEISGLKRGAFYTAHCPERVLPGRILYELAHNDRIIGAEREDSALKAQALYQSFVKEGSIHLTDDVTAEMCKLVENSFRDVNIAFANELSILCDAIGIDVMQLIDLANKHPRVNILSPGVGVGGHCIAVDPWFLVEKFKDKAKMIHTARVVNDSKPAWICEKIEKNVQYNKNATICILGLTFKANVDDFRSSPALELAEMLKDKGYPVIACEPNTTKREVNGIAICSLDEAVSQADYLVLAVKHEEFLARIDEINQTNCLIL